MSAVKSKGYELDMLNGSIWDKIIIFALPLAFTAVLQQLFNAADTAVLGQYVGKDAIAAVGNNISLIGLLVNLFLGLSLGLIRNAECGIRNWGSGRCIVGLGGWRLGLGTLPLTLCPLP